MNDTPIIIFSIAFGALLAIVGGWIGDEIRAARMQKRELKSIKTILADELGEIETTLKTMREVWAKSKIFYPTYITDIQSGMSSFESIRQRLFLIDDQDLRKKIVAFYKKLKDTAKKSEGKVGTLANTPVALAEQTGFDTSFQELQTEAGGIKGELEKKS